MTSRITLPKTPKRFLDLVHLAVAGIWLGGFSIMLGCSILATTGGISAAEGSATLALVRDLVKFCIPALMVTGILYGACTKWGFFKHRWVIAKWLLAILVAASTALAPANPLCLSGVVAGMVALFAISVFKPRLEPASDRARG